MSAIEIADFVFVYIVGPLAAVATLWVIFLTVFTRLKFVRRIRCGRMGWHSHPHFETTGFDGASVHARCEWCGYEGMIDSQGNLF